MKLDPEYRPVDRPVHHPPMVINTPVPDDMPMPQHAAQPFTIRDLIQRLRGQPQQVAPAPKPEPMPEPRSVLKR